MFGGSAAAVEGAVVHRSYEEQQLLERLAVRRGLARRSSLLRGAATPALRRGCCRRRTSLIAPTRSSNRKRACRAKSTKTGRSSLLRGAATAPPPRTPPCRSPSLIAPTRSSNSCADWASVRRTEVAHRSYEEQQRDVGDPVAAGRLRRSSLLRGAATPRPVPGRSRARPSLIAPTRSSNVLPFVVVRWSLAVAHRSYEEQQPVPDLRVEPAVAGRLSLLRGAATSRCRCATRWPAMSIIAPTRSSNTPTTAPCRSRCAVAHRSYEEQQRRLVAQRGKAPEGRSSLLRGAATGRRPCAGPSVRAVAHRSYEEQQQLRDAQQRHAHPGGSWLLRGAATCSGPSTGSSRRWSIIAPTRSSNSAAPSIRTIRTMVAYRSYEEQQLRQRRPEARRRVRRSSLLRGAATPRDAGRPGPARRSLIAPMRSSNNTSGSAPHPDQRVAHRSYEEQQQLVVPGHDVVERRRSSLLRGAATRCRAPGEHRRPESLIALTRSSNAISAPHSSSLRAVAHRSCEEQQRGRFRGVGLHGLESLIAPTRSNNDAAFFRGATRDEIAYRSYEECGRRPGFLRGRAA